MKIQFPTRIPPYLEQNGGWILAISIPNQGTAFMYLLGYKDENAGTFAELIDAYEPGARLLDMKWIDKKG